jgi:hypothetical protein
MLSELLTKSAPKYPVTIHSTGKTVYFRPFLVREEKALLLALEENNPQGIMKAISDIIFSCCEEIKNPLELPIYDIENLFLQIRAKSVGEVIDLTFKDDDTGELISEKINIADIKLNGEPSKETLDLNDSLKVTFRYPVLSDFMEETIDLSETEGYYNLIANCLTKIETPEESIDAKTYDTKEVKDFLESMNKTQFTKVLNYFAKMPKLTYTLKYNNANGQEKTIKLEGIQDFFGLPSVTLV